MKTLLIDDVRNLKADEVARNFADGIRALRSQRWDHLLLDHDLASYSPMGKKEYTGYDIACWLERNPQYMPKKVTVVSSNPVGVAKIKRALMKFAVIF